MDLHVTLAAGPGARLPGGAATEELVISRAHLVTGEKLREQLAVRTGVEHFLVRGTPLHQLQPGVPPLTSGAVIVASTDQHCSMISSAASNLFFIVRSGPDAGVAVPLSRGTYTIGRGGADISIQDPELSRLHAVLSVTNDSLTLRNRRSANGVWVDGEQVEEVTVSTDSVIVLGSSVCVLVLMDSPPQTVTAVDVNAPCEVSAPPPPEGHRLLILTALLPLGLGIGLALATGMWFFLAFSALSAVTGLVPLLNGRRKRRTFKAAVSTAVAADRERRRCAALNVGSLAVAALHPPILSAPQPEFSSTGLYLHLGHAAQRANIEVKPEPTGWHPPLLVNIPVLIPLTEPMGGKPLNLLVRGPRTTLFRVAHLLLLQLAVLREAGEVLCFGPVSQLPKAARFLPRVTLIAQRERISELLATGRYSTLLLFGAEFPLAATGLRTIRFTASAEAAEGQWIADYFHPKPVLTTPTGSLVFLPDYVRGGTFDVVSRGIAARAGRVGGPPEARSIPESVTIHDLISTDSASIAGRWRKPWNGMHLKAWIGSSAVAFVGVDLVSDGPHLLVAGTTGSGKSEFLRTFVLGLALSYSPANLNLLFIDFKGGSGLGALVQLPHVTGLLTDLSAAAVSRALVSLKAEVKRRERIFARVGVADYQEHQERASDQLPRLVIVVDEFRVLSEEVPGSVDELMRIAALGRSLGMHLVLATQRPQGAITSEIRANITASVALRMQSAVDSQDVLGSSAAYSIPVSLPGRAYLRIASAPPLEFQTGTTTATGPSNPSAAILGYDTAVMEPGACGPAEIARVAPESKVPTGSEHVHELVRMVVDAAHAVPFPAPCGPVLPPLPATVVRSPASSPRVPQLGLLDIPEYQEQRSLAWNPDSHSHLAFLGQAGGGLEAVLYSVAAEHLCALPDRHLYVLDATSALRSFEDAPQVGAYVTPFEVKRAARVLQRIAGLIADRLGGAGKTPVAAQSITVIVTGWGRWSAAFRSGRFAWAEDVLQDIVRDGEPCGIALVIAGERELISSRLFSMLPNRLYLPLGASPETLLNWPKLPPMDTHPGRAFVQGRLSTGVGAVAQLLTASDTVPPIPPARLPFKVQTLPSSISSQSLPLASVSSHAVHIPVGIGGDELEPVHLALPQRSVALLVGTAGTGKSLTLDLIARMAPQSLRCVHPATGEDPEVFWRHHVPTSSPEELLLIDDADLLSRETHQDLAAMVSSGARAVFAGSPSPALGTNPALAGLRLNPLGIILGPHAPTDGEVFGMRVDVDGRPPPGRGVLVSSRGSMEVQIAFYE